MKPIIGAIYKDDELNITYLVIAIDPGNGDIFVLPRGRDDLWDYDDIWDWPIESCRNDIRILDYNEKLEDLL